MSTASDERKHVAAAAKKYEFKLPDKCSAQAAAIPL